MVKFGLALRRPFGFCSECNIHVSIALLCTVIDSRCPLCQCAVAGMAMTAMATVGLSCNSNMISSLKSHLSFSQLLIVMWVLGGHLVQNPINHHTFRKEKWGLSRTLKGPYSWCIYWPLSSPPIHLGYGRREGASLLFVFVQSFFHSLFNIANTQRHVVVL